MAKTNNRFASEVKLKAVLRLLRGESPVTIAAEVGCHPTMLKGWKDQFLATAPQLFETKKTADEKTKRIEQLERLIGKQAVQIEFLKKVHESLESM